MPSRFTRRALISRTIPGAFGLYAVSSSSPLAQSILDGLRGSLDAADEGLVPGAADDQSALLTRALQKAEAAGQALFLPPGRYEVADVALPSHAHIVGIPGQTRLVFRGGRFLLSAQNAALLRLEGLTLDGAGMSLDADVPGLVLADNVDDIGIGDCQVTGSAAAGILLRNSAGRIERCRVENARTVGLHLRQSRGMTASDNVVFDCGDTGILVEREEESRDDTIVRGNRVSRIDAKSGGTGQYGNGINLAKANGVIVADNRIDDCAFSAIRAFSSDDVSITGNLATNSGEMAIYVEFAFEGAVVSNNLIDGAAYGISFANFMEYGGRLAVCSGNVIRNISGVPRLPRGEPLTGAGIGAEADTAISGNVVENAQQGLQLGWGPYLRDVSATGNVIRRSPIGIAVSVVEGAGPALIANNLISGADRGAILGMRWADVATGDLTKGGAEAFPSLTLAGNRAG